VLGLALMPGSSSTIPNYYLKSLRARRSRGTPRIANNLLRRTRDFAEIKGDGTITKLIAEMALTALEIDQYGLDDMDIRILSTIINKFKGGPVGISTIATACGEEAETIEEVYEPFLIMEGFINIPPSRTRGLFDG